MTYTIPESRRAEVEKAVARLNKKAERYGKAFTVKYGEPYATEVAVYERDYINNCVVSDKTIMVEAFDVEIDGEIVKMDGYEVVAHIEHLDGGNIVNAFDGEVEPEWVLGDCTCDHCRTNRIRKHTFIVRKGDNEVRVGKTCLRDYCGIDPQMIGYRNELRDILLGEDIENYDWMGKAHEYAYSVVKALALAIKVYRSQGYIKSDKPHSNKDTLTDLVLDEEKPTEAEMAEAEKMAKAIDEMTEDDALRFLLSDTRSLIRSTYCKKKHFGYLAYAPVAYQNYLVELEKRAKREAEKKDQMKSVHVGEVGKRQTFEIASHRLITSWETQYGTTYLYKFTTVDGNILIWYASSIFGHWDKSGKVQRFIEERNVSRIKATVKCHNERDGVQQTVVTRVKAERTESAPPEPQPYKGTAQEGFDLFWSCVESEGQKESI